MIKVSSASSKRQRRLCGTTLVPVYTNGHSLTPYGRKSTVLTERGIPLLGRRLRGDIRLRCGCLAPTDSSLKHRDANCLSPS